MIALEQEIRRSEGVLESTPRPFQPETWRDAVHMLRRWSSGFAGRYGRTMPVPTIAPGPGGSVDLHWRTDRFEMLVNVSTRPGEVSTFYGDDEAGNGRIEGRLDPVGTAPGEVLRLLAG